MKNKLKLIAALAELIETNDESCPFQSFELEHIAGTISIIAKQAQQQFAFEEMLIKKSKENEPCNS